MIFLYMDVWFYIWQDYLQWYCTTSAAIQVQVKTDYDDFGFKIISGTRILLTSLAPYTYCEFSISQNHICTVAHHDDIDIKRLFDICQNFPTSCPLPKRLRKNLKMNFRFSLPRKLVRVWFHFKWFLMLYNLSYLDSSFINSAPKSQKSRNST